jgi:hypothetical protein
MKYYGLVWSKDADDLVEKVNAALQEGWQPLGGIAISQIFYPQVEKSISYAQAIVKEDN